MAAGVAGPLPPAVEEELAEGLCRHIPWIEAVRFLKTGAEAVAAAGRLARVATGRDLALGCGYHGWLDWCQGGGIEGVPAATRALYAELPFNDSERTRQQIREAGDRLAVVVVEPVVVEEPRREWLAGPPGGEARGGGGPGVCGRKTPLPRPGGGGGGGAPGGARRPGGPQGGCSPHLDPLKPGDGERGARRSARHARCRGLAGRAGAPASRGDAVVPRAAPPAARACRRRCGGGRGGRDVLPPLRER